MAAVRTLKENTKTYLDQFIGQLGWLDTSLPEALRIVYVITLMVIALVDTQGNVAVRCKQKGIISGVLLASMVLIGTALYLTATPVGSRTIGGIQGRYFIPISPLFFLLFHNKKVRIDLETPGFYGAMISFILFSLTSTVFVIMRRYYVS